MSFDFSSLVTDRTQADVEARNDKGTYQAADLNRVTQAMDALANQFSVLGYSTAGYWDKRTLIQWFVRTNQLKKGHR